MDIDIMPGVGEDGGNALNGVNSGVLRKLS
jgi:hypothetical protein